MAVHCSSPSVLPQSSSSSSCWWPVPGAGGQRPATEPMPASRIRNVHPLAWWAWALGIAVATTRSPGVTSTVLLIGAVVLVVALCHDGSSFARAFPAYLALAAAIVVIRVFFYVLVGVKSGGQTVLELPAIPLPQWAGGIELLGPVGATGLVAATSTGLALAALLLCFGAAIALTNPQRTLRSLPASLHLLGTATVIAMTLAPQLVESWYRVRRAQSLRGRPLRRSRAAVATTVPVLEDALDRSLTIAAAMDSRGYARVHRGSSALVSALMLSALLGAAIGAYALLDGTSPRWLAVPLLAVAAATAVLGSMIASRRILTTRYRPDRWRVRESLIAASGVAIAGLAGFFAGESGTAGWSATFLLCAILVLSPIPVVMAR